ncbi:MAG: DUF1501 domain-containing protein [Pseudomonadota bacterium]
MAYYNRRLFLKASEAGFLGATGALAGLSRQRAFAASTGGYKALVGVFLKGGSDMFDAVLPHDQPSYDSFLDLRPGIVNGYGNGSRARENLLALNPAGPNPFSGRTFGLVPELAPFKAMFDSGEGAMVGAVGPLLTPTSKTGMNAGTDALPRKLFSHNDQQSTWMAMETEGVRRGWGGSFMDEMIRNGGIGNPDFALITGGSSDIFLASERANQFKAPSNPTSLGIDMSVKTYLTSGSHGQEARDLLNAFLEDTTHGSDNPFARDVVAGQARGIENMRNYREAFTQAPGLQTVFPNTRLGNQLLAVANAINLRGVIGTTRQVFYADTGGFDTHNNQPGSMTGRLSEVADAIGAFRDAMIEMGVWNDVTLFTMSDFGRTLTDNGDGTDHGWGSHQFVFGGSVQGQRIYGDMPELDPDSERFTRTRARLIPSVSVDQYAATLGAWFGLDSSEIDRVLPNLNRFATRDLGFMSGSSA